MQYFISQLSDALRSEYRQARVGSPNGKEVVRSAILSPLHGRGKRFQAGYRLATLILVTRGRCLPQTQDKEESQVKTLAWEAAVQFQLCHRPSVQPLSTHIISFGEMLATFSLTSVELNVTPWISLVYLLS